MKFEEGFIVWADDEIIECIRPEDCIVPNISAMAYICQYCGSVNSGNRCKNCGAPITGGKYHA